MFQFWNQKREREATDWDLLLPRLGGRPEQQQRKYGLGQREKTVQNKFAEEN